MEDKIIKKLQNHDNRFDKLDQQVDTLARTVVNIQEQVNDIKEGMATKSDISNMSNTLDELVGLAKKKDEELTFMGERVKRIEDNVKRLKPLSV